MSKHSFHIALLLLLALSGCIKDKANEERRKWTVTLDHTDKRPYGAYLAFESLKHYFPGTTIHTLSAGFRYTNMDGKMKYDGHTLLILEGFNFFVSENEWHDLQQYISNGNEVIIFTSIFDSKIEKALGCDKKLGGTEGYNYYSFIKDHNNKKSLRITNAPGKLFGYTGHSIKSYFEFPDSTLAKLTDSAAANVLADTTNVYTTDSTYPDSTNTDSSYTDSNNSTTYSDENTSTPDFVWSGPDTLGYAYDRPNVIRYTLGEGHLTLHAAPLILSNYFLLQDGNEQYLSAVWQTLPNNINNIYWNDYYSRTTEASSTEILWRHRATRLALMLGIFALLVYILFEGKRKQRIIPIIAPLKNDSVSFVETVGRLYYNKGNHVNLAEKMMQQFLEWVRINYLLNTNQLNEQFIHQLTIKSGQPEATVRAIVDMIHEIRLRSVKIDDPYLFQLYNTIQQFYKNRRL